MRMRTLGATTIGDDGFRGAHRTGTKRDLCIMACVFCRDPEFLQWLDDTHPLKDPTPPKVIISFGDGTKVESAGLLVHGEGSAKAFILSMCQTDSRSKLDTDTAAGLRFLQLVRTPFLEWKEAQ